MWSSRFIRIDSFLFGLLVSCLYWMSIYSFLFYTLIILSCCTFIRGFQEILVLLLFSPSSRYFLPVPIVHDNLIPKAHFVKTRLCVGVKSENSLTIHQKTMNKRHSQRVYHRSRQWSKPSYFCLWYLNTFARNTMYSSTYSW